MHHSYDYDINLSKGVNVLTGPNGYGKTTILNIVDSVLSGKFWRLFFVKFDSLRIFFEDNRQRYSLFCDAKEIESEGINEQNESVVEKGQICISFYMEDNEVPIEQLVIGQAYKKRLTSRFLSNLPYSLNDRDIEDALESTYRLKDDSYLNENAKNILMFLQQQKACFIREQRLVDIKSDFSSISYRRMFSRKIYTVEDIETDLRSLYASYREDFARESQKIDASFIMRLISEDHEEYSEEEYNEKWRRLSDTMKAYREYGLVAQGDVLRDYPDGLRKMLSLYIDDLQKKMDIYRDFYERLSLFENFVSKKQWSNKRIELNPETGISVINDVNEVIPLRKLSSGEQNLIILYYKLAFTMQPNSLLLIDEPEKSLHVEWLEKMLDDYKLMAQKLSCQMLIATHSPVFINGEWDLTTDLYLNAKAQKA